MMNLPKLNLKPKTTAAAPALKLPAKPAPKPAGATPAAKPAPGRSLAPKPSAGKATAAATQQRSIVRPRQRVVTTQYRVSEHTQSYGGLPEGDLFYLTDAPSFQVVRPDWKGKFPTTFRPFPTINVDDMVSFEAGRYSAKKANDFTDWVRSLPAAKHVGIDSPVSFLLFDPRWKNDQGYSPRDNPYNILYYAIKEVVNADNPSAMLGRKDVFNGRWINLFKKSFSNPGNKATFIQGAVYQHRDKIYVQGGKAPLGLGKDDKPQIIEMASGSCWDSLCDILDQKPDGVRATSDDIMGTYVYGDPTLTNGGTFLTVYNPDVHMSSIAFQFGATRTDEGQSVETDTIEYEDPNSDDDDDRGGRKKKKEFTSWKVAAGYDLYYTNKEGVRKKANPDITAYEDRIREQFLWFDDLFHFPTTEEVVEILAKAFRGAPNMLRFGWSEHPEFFTDSVKGILAARTQGTMPEIPPDDDEQDSRNRRAAGGGRRSASLIEDVDMPEADPSDEDLIDSADAFESGEDSEFETEIDAEGDDQVDEELDESEDADVDHAAQAAANRAALRLPAKQPSAAPGDLVMAKKKAAKKPAPKPSAKPSKK